MEGILYNDGRWYDEPCHTHEEVLLALRKSDLNPIRQGELAIHHSVTAVSPTPP
ncbi:MAG: hypothetical protein IAE79_17100 [Anaerolinea sp.]|nr:hypothetical protein [Anaerolinea sp.]